MAVRYITISDLQDFARESFSESEPAISDVEHNPLGAMRGFVFALLIEAALVLVGGVGWELWRMAR